MNETIQERVVSMLQHTGLSDGFYAEALLMSVHIINMSPSRPLGHQIPQELWTGSKPNYDKLRIFGCEAYALIPKYDRQKLEPRSRKCVFLGYRPDSEIRYQLWDPEHKQIVRSSNVVFNELAMHKTVERPIKVRRVIFSEVPTLHEGPAHNMRSVSRVIDNSRTESTNSAQPNGSGLDKPTQTPGATTPVIPRRFERLSQPPDRYSPRIFFTDAGECRIPMYNGRIPTILLDSPSSGHLCK